MIGELRAEYRDQDQNTVEAIRVTPRNFYGVMDWLASDGSSLAIMSSVDEGDWLCHQDDNWFVLTHEKFKNSMTPTLHR